MQEPQQATAPTNASHLGSTPVPKTTSEVAVTITEAPACHKWYSQAESASDVKVMRSAPSRIVDLLDMNTISSESSVPPTHPRILPLHELRE